MPLAHKIGAALALVPFFVGLLTIFFWDPEPIVHGSGMTASKAVAIWWAIAIGIYVTVRFVSFVINGRWR
jgi:hypothetical protein